MAVVEIVLSDPPSAATAVGFALDEDYVATVGGVRLVFAATGAGREGGISGWTMRGAGSGDIDGLATLWSRNAPGGGTPAKEHPNGAVSVDHVVVTSPDRERTTAAFERAGLSARRVRPVPGGEMSQTFFRAGEVIVEMVAPEVRPEAGTDAPARFWGLAFTVADLEATVAGLGEACGPARPAVQPGRRIATLRQDRVGLGFPVAFISAEPRRQRSAPRP